MSSLTTVKRFFFRFRDGFVVVLPLATVAMVCALLWGGPALKDALDGSLFHDLKLNYPVYLDLDAHDNLFIIDQNSRRIVSLTPQGVERWTIEGGQRERGIYETYRLAATPDGGVVAYNFVRDSQDRLSAEEFVRFGSQGEYRGTLVRIDYPEDQRTSDEEHLRSLTIQDGLLYYLWSHDGRVDLRRRSLDPEEGGVAPPSHPSVFSAAVSLDLVAAVPHLPQGILGADRRGAMVLIRPDGQVVQPPFGIGGPLEKPWDLKVGPRGETLILDNYRGEVYSVPTLDAPAVFPVFGQAQVLAKGKQSPSFEGIAVGSRGTVGVVDKFNHSVFLLGTDHKVRIVSGGIKSDLDLLKSWSLLGLDAGALVLGIWALVGFLRRQFADKTSLIVKQILVFLPLVIVSVTVGSFAIYRIMDGIFQKELRSKLLIVADLGAQTIDGALVQQIAKASDWDGPAHRALGVQFTSVLHGNKDDWNKDLRTVIYKYQNDRFYFVKNYSSYYGVMFPYGGAQPEHFAAARGGSVESAQYSDEYGTYLSGIAPLKDAGGTITGVLEVYLNYDTVTENTQAFVGQLLQGIFFVILTVLGLLLIVDVLIFLSLGYLRRASRKLMGGELGISVPARRRDEIGDLAQDFNTMSLRLRDLFDRLKRVRDANARFVPQAFLEYLNKDSLASIRSGDQVRRFMTVFFADIRSFTSLSEKMTPKENFDFINEYFGVMGPVVRAHGGFIDRYLGDAILALFPGRPSDAVLAAWDMRKALEGFNSRRRAAGRVPIDFGVGIHAEELTLGVVGEADRLSVTVVSQAVDLVNHLEAATKAHQVHGVITRPVWLDLTPDLRDRARPLGVWKEDEAEVEIYGI